VLFTASYVGVVPAVTSAHDTTVDILCCRRYWPAGGNVCGLNAVDARWRRYPAKRIDSILFVSLRRPDVVGVTADIIGWRCWPHDVVLYDVTGGDMRHAAPSNWLSNT